MDQLGARISTAGELKETLKGVPDNALLNIGNRENGFSIDKIFFDGLSVALETEEDGAFEPVTDGKIAAAKRCLIDNGIKREEAETVLQTLGYILLNIELFPNRDKKQSLDEQIQSVANRTEKDQRVSYLKVKETAFEM